MSMKKILIHAALLGMFACPLTATSQEPGPAPVAEETQANIDEGLQEAEAALAEDDADPAIQQESVPAADAPGSEKQIDLLELLLAGGHLMWPILAMSLLVVTFGTERALGLRRRKVLPPVLIEQLGKLGHQPGGLDPRKAYKLCQKYPSAAANVIRTMLLKVGRPHGELEHAVSEANEREAAHLYSNVRWLALAAAVTPLLGLLGTVWGMIKAFFVTANLPTGANKAEHLADGIYTALVTTFAGLAVAIPAAVLAHLFEGRIQKLFRELDETLLGLLPQLERFEGRLRVTRNPQGSPAAAQREDPTSQSGPQPPAAAPQ